MVPEGAFTVRAEMNGQLSGETLDEIVSHGQVVQVAIVRQAEPTVEGTVVASDVETAIPGTRVNR